MAHVMGGKCGEGITDCGGGCGENHSLRVGCGLLTKLEGRRLGLALHSPAAVLPTEVQIHNLCPRGPVLRP